MTYFKNIHSLAELKKEYRRLALENHPDKGGSTEVMQQINVEFERLHEIWKDDTTVSANASGYENDYAGASAKEYTDFVYNEYRWKGRNYQGQHTPEIVELVRNWMKETYPKYKFSVSRHHYNSIHIYLVKADFEAFKKDKGVVFHHDVNHYNIDNDDTLTDRAKEVMKNVCDFVMSYNFDDSDPMTDYFCTNFYLTLGVGTYKKPYKVELPKLDCKGKKPDVFKHPEGVAHKAIRQALGGAYFSFHNSQRLQGKMVLGEDSYGHSGDKYFGHYHTQVPRPHRNEWINWRKPVSAVNSRATMAAASSSSATHPKRKHYLNKSVKRSLLHIKSGRLSRYRLHKEKSVVLILDNRPS